MSKQGEGGIPPGAAQGARPAGLAEPAAEGGVAQQTVEGLGEGRGVTGLDEQAGFAIGDRLGHAADVVRDDGQAVRPGLKIDETETLDAVFMGHRGHGEDVGLCVDGAEFLVGDVAQETHGEVGPGGRGIEQLVVVFLPMGADEPVFERRAAGRGQGLEGVDDLELAG